MKNRRGFCFCSLHHRWILLKYIQYAHGVFISRETRYKVAEIRIADLVGTLEQSRLFAGWYFKKVGFGSAKLGSQAPVTCQNKWVTVKHTSKSTTWEENHRKATPLK